MNPMRSIRQAVFAGALAAGCARGGPGTSDTVVVYAAASVATPLRTFARAYSVRTGAVSHIELGGSLEHARKLTELGRPADVLVLADHEVLASLMPKYVGWYLAFAHSRMVIAYTARSRRAAELTAANWPDVLTKAGVSIGRPDPSVAPAGYRALIMFQLAEQEYRRPGLADRLLQHADAHYVRPNAAELASLLEAGEVDYIVDYESVARAHGFQFITLPPTIDLSDPRRALEYARASVRVRGGSGDSITVHGTAILYALTIPVGAPHSFAARRFIDALLGPEGTHAFQAGFVELLPQPALVGSGAPAEVAARVVR
jgi:molybdate/tungstate transport system substrate-binding protein